MTEIGRQLKLLDYMIQQYQFSLRDAIGKAISLGFNPDENTHICAMREGLAEMIMAAGKLRAEYCDGSNHETW